MMSLSKLQKQPKDLKRMFRDLNKVIEARNKMTHYKSHRHLFPLSLVFDNKISDDETKIHTPDGHLFNNFDELTAHLQRNIGLPTLQEAQEVYSTINEIIGAYFTAKQGADFSDVFFKQYYKIKTVK